MNPRLRLLQDFIRQDKVHVADHAYDAAMERQIDLLNAIDGAMEGRIVEDYLEFRGQDRVLILQSEPSGQPLHTAWDFPVPPEDFVMLVTVYRPGV